ncbi:MAG TPA: hypothetical protein VGP82_12805 [Ktedonobacterales bacterium]|nr:hypothetical protein [Ktedonobacterales bacterium]
MLEGLSVGDVFGDLHLNRARVHELPSGPWRVIDDTQMALSIAAILGMSGEIEQKSLAHSFGLRFEVSRGMARACAIFFHIFVRAGPGNRSHMPCSTVQARPAMARPWRGNACGTRWRLFC